MAADLKLRQRVLSRWGALKVEREPFMAQWHEISSLITPSRGRFLEPKANQNEARFRWNRIYDNTTKSWPRWRRGRNPSTRRRVERYALCA